MEFSLKKPVSYGFDEAVERVTSLLSEQGFGILTEIDVKTTFKDKLGLEFRPCRILGSCNPRLAEQAFAIEPQIGALMPCNWTIQELEDGVEVSVMNPATLVEITGNVELRDVEAEVVERVNAVLGAL